MTPPSRDRELPFIPNQATHFDEDLPPLKDLKVKLEYVSPPDSAQGAGQPESGQDKHNVRSSARVPKQTRALRSSDSELEKWSCYKVSVTDGTSRIPVSINGEPLFQEYLYLFNVVIALEWMPSAVTLQQIRLAAQKASNFLYDVTDGYMAFGTVRIGGPELMAGADIQIMASNRLHPRAWVDALHVDDKFMPIRVGRGLWQKNQGTLLTWDTPEGYRALIHEWGHYAFALSDEYLGRVWLHRGAAPAQQWNKAELEIAVPTLALPVETVMANTQISEFASRKTVIDEIKKRFPQVGMNVDRPLEGPDALPLPLPDFSDEPKPVPGDLILDIQEIPTTLIPDVRDATIWVYLLTPAAGGDHPERIIAQGKIGSRDWASGFRLLGAKDNDQIVLISQAGDEVRVLSNTVRLPANTTAPAGVESTWSPATPWQDITPLPLQDPRHFFVDVVPQELQAVDGRFPRWSDVSVHVEADMAPDTVTLFPLGQMPAVPLQPDSTKNWWGPASVDHLDGHVLLRWPEQDQRVPLFICGYSQGGGPGTSGGGHCLPMTAGSADGNVMIFFLENSPPFGDGESRGDQGVRMVTTTMTVGQQKLADSSEARSYIFSVASNASLAPYPGTIVLFYDREAPEHDQDLLIYRWDWLNDNWKAQITFDPPGLSYVALPLTVEARAAAPQLLRAGAPRIERYRVYLSPRRSTEIGAVAS